MGEPFWRKVPSDSLQKLFGSIASRSVFVVCFLFFVFRVFTLLPSSFFDRAPEQVARDLLGRLLVRRSRAGLTAGTNRKKAEREFKSAVSAGAKAVKTLDKLAMDKDSDLAEAAQDLRQNAGTALVGVHLNLGSHYLTFGKNKDALSQANKALALDPGHS